MKRVVLGRNSSLVAAIAASLTIGMAGNNTADAEHDAPPSVDPRPRKVRRRKDWEQGQYRKRSRR